MAEVKITAADARDLNTAIRALDRMAERHDEAGGGDWHSDDLDQVASARSALRNWHGWNRIPVEQGGLA